jgi:ABC-type polysaccharide/polyol phosphate export permease
LVLAAIHVYARDVKHLVQASLLLWFYATPIFYPPSLLGRFEWLLLLNPMVGIVHLFRLATLGEAVDSPGASVLVSVVVTAALAALAVELYRRLDRLFVDRL